MSELTLYKSAPEGEGKSEVFEISHQVRDKDEKNSCCKKKKLMCVTVFYDNMFCFIIFTLLFWNSLVFWKS